MAFSYGKCIWNGFWEGVLENSENVENLRIWSTIAQQNDSIIYYANNFLRTEFYGTNPCAINLEGEFATQRLVKVVDIEIIVYKSQKWLY